ncbi:type VII secretion protein EccE [Mycolicibacterium sphagni]|uniref:Type VII secretion protein EccE n=1 Tax=Mycolicibacterium sphagni TaxID=1786 RepID=A0ABX2K397_9MYCO|nr:type VII secretion protein EccE [Mycolicibacterium sphagni]NTY60705.1 type VII secretion protein EccE [Mycolicibacterium sphagni]
MRNPLRSFGLRFTVGHLTVAAVLVPPSVILLIDTPHRRWGIGLLVAAVLLTIISVRGRRITEWIAALFAWIWRHRTPLAGPSEPVVGATHMPGDHVAVRWEGDVLVALIELIPRPFTPTVIVGGRVHSDDVIDTRLVEQLLAVHCPDLEADIVSAGHRIGRTASDDAMSQYGTVIASDPAPAQRRTWVVLRADPGRTQRSSLRRDRGVPGMVRYLVASTTRIADGLASHGVDAVCSRSFDDYDRGVEISFVRERWGRIKGHNSFTSAYSASGGPDVWWAAPAAHTVTRIRVAPGSAPRSCLLLTTEGKTEKPRGFSRLSGSQRAALQGRLLVGDRHCQLPIGSAGVFIGQTANKYPVYMPFDDVDASLTLGDARTFTQFAARAAAAGGIVTLAPQFRELAALIGAEVGPQPKVVWPHATTYLEPHPGVERVTLRRNMIGTPRHRQLPVRTLSTKTEIGYESALP